MKPTIGPSEGGDRSARTHPLKEKNRKGKKPKRKPEGKTVWVKGPSPPMANHALDLIFKPRPTS